MRLFYKQRLGPSLLYGENSWVVRRKDTEKFLDYHKRWVKYREDAKIFDKHRAALLVWELNRGGDLG